MSSSSSNSNNNNNNNSSNNVVTTTITSPNVGSLRSNTVRSFKVMDVLRKANDLQQKLDSDYDAATAAATSELKTKTTATEEGFLEEDEKEIIIEQHEREREPRIQVLHLEVGQPETGAPKQVADAAIQALTTTSTSLTPSSSSKTNVMGYTDAFGLVELRQRIRQHYIDKYYSNNNMNRTNNSNMLSLIHI